MTTQTQRKTTASLGLAGFAISILGLIFSPFEHEISETSFSQESLKWCSFSSQSWTEIMQRERDPHCIVPFPNEIQNMGGI